MQSLNVGQEEPLLIIQLVSMFSLSNTFKKLRSFLKNHHR